MEGKPKLSFTKMAELSGVSEASCRRYTKKNPKLFMSVHRDGVTRFPEEAVDRFRAMQAALAEGLRWGEAVRQLQEQFGLVYDVEPIKEGEAEATDEALSLRDIGPRLDRLAAAVEALAAAQQETVELLKAHQPQLPEVQAEPTEAEDAPKQGGLFRALVKIFGGGRHGE